MWEDNNQEMYQEVIAYLIEVIKDQNIELVSLRYLLSNYMEYPGDEYLRMEIFNCLYPLFAGHREFEEYIEKECKGKDPFEQKRYRLKLSKAAKGIEVGDHPLIYTGYLK